MLQKVSKALLLSDVSSFANNYKELASDIDVKMTVEAEWNTRYRVSADVVILGSKYLEYLNRSYYTMAVIILKEGESPAPYIKEGISHFIFNYKNHYELLCALYKEEKTVIHATSKDLEFLLKESSATRFCVGKYDFDFLKNTFKYNGKLIYLPDSQKKYLAEWLLNGHKDNRRRMVICNLRKKLGEDFLRDVDRFGQIKGVVK